MMIGLRGLAFRWIIGYGESYAITVLPAPAGTLLLAENVHGMKGLRIPQHQRRVPTLVFQCLNAGSVRNHSPEPFSARSEKV